MDFRGSKYTLRIGYCLEELTFKAEIPSIHRTVDWVYDLTP